MVLQIAELSKAKLSFFTNISHELRTPLTLIKGPLDQLMHHEQELPQQTKKKLFHLIDKNTNRLLKLINQLLEFRKIEKSNLEVQYQWINLPQYIQEIIEPFENFAQLKDIHLEFEKECDQLEFLIDPDKFEKIAVNLISNAFKHTHPGDSIRVGLDLVRARDYDFLDIHDSYIRLEVEDTGTGISEEDLQHIYERFFSKDLDDANQSSGIGLAYIKELIDLLQGKIKVESKLGEGSKFSIYLPSQKGAKMIEIETIRTPRGLADQEVTSLIDIHEADQQKEELNHNLDADNQKVLIVEDNPDMQLFIISALTQYDVITAPNGVKGIEKAKTHDIDLIISDIKMPEMDGLTFCQKIKTNPATQHIPVILLTAKSMDESRIKSYEIGADAYMTKPFSPNILLARIENLLEQRKSLKSTFTREILLTPDKIEVRSQDDELLLTLANIIEENHEDPGFNVNQMCKMVHLSHMHFIRKVKELTGKKPIDLLRSYRMERAKDLLAQNKLSISEVAYKVGYDLPNSFSRSFKKEYGMSPKQYIAKTIEEISG